LEIIESGNKGTRKPRDQKVENLRRRRFTLFKKAHEISKIFEVDAIVILRYKKTDRCFTFQSADLPLLMVEIVNEMQQRMYPIVDFHSQDMEE
jgi:hypothetical protein